MTFPARIFIVALVSVAGVTSSAAAMESVPAKVSQFAQRYCVACHGPDEQEGDFRVDTLGISQNTADAAMWQLVLENLYSGNMPPAEHELRPEFKEVEPITGWIEEELKRARRALQGLTGEVVFRRLNRSEYVYTINDLFDIQGTFAEAFPEDNTSHGFDVIGAALMLSAAQLDEYTKAANEIIGQVLTTGPDPTVQRVESSLHRINKRSWAGHDNQMKSREADFERLTETEQRNFLRDKKRAAERPNMGFTMYLWENGRLREPERDEADADLAIVQQAYFSNNLDTQLFFRPPQPGWYRYTIHAASTRNDGKPVPLLVSHNSGWGSTGDFSKPVETLLIEPGEPKPYEVMVYMRPAETLSLKMLAGPYVFGGDNSPIDSDTPIIIVRSDRMEGPVHREMPPRGFSTLFGPHDPEDTSDETIRSIIHHFGSRLFRRPVEASAADRFLRFYQAQAEEQPHEEALHNLFVAMMISPRFLYRLEPPKGPDSYAIATRLSYFLWRSTPDDELLRAAAAKELDRPEQVTVQIERMLAHPRSERFIRDFTSQWLRTGEVGDMRADPNLYPEYDDSLELAIAEETYQFIQEMITHNIPVDNLIDSDWTMLNERLAKHYDIPGVEGPHFRRVSLDKGSTVRGGLLTQASMHAVTSDGTNTSPIYRGIWVLDNFLGTPPPPPPPDIPAIEPDIRGTTTILEQLEKHRELPACASCHSRIDPLGIALENFDVIGGWRESYRGLETASAGRSTIIEGRPVDSAITLPGARRIESFQEFRGALLERSDRVATNVAQKLATFALGRELDFTDRDDIDSIIADTKERDHGMRDIIHAVVKSPLFRKP